MEKKFDVTKKKNSIPNSVISKKESYGVLRVSEEVHRMVKMNALLDDKTMRDYVEELIIKDNEKRAEK